MCIADLKITISVADSKHVSDVVRVAQRCGPWEVVRLTAKVASQPEGYLVREVARARKVEGIVDQLGAILSGNDLEPHKVGAIMNNYFLEFDYQIF